MKFGLSHNLAEQNNECLVMGIFADEHHIEDTLRATKSTQAMVDKLAIKTYESGDMLWHHEHPDNSMLVVHCGKKDEYTPTVLNKRLSEITDTLIKNKISSASIYMPKLINKSANWQLEQMVFAIAYQAYEFLHFKTQNHKPARLESVTLIMPDATQETLDLSEKIAQAVAHTRDLANAPANQCTPSHLAEKAQELAKKHNKISCTVMGPKEINKLKMGALEAVARGSQEPARFIELQYKGDNKNPPIVLVGKGVTFDTGGISIKPAQSMEEMKFDMCGAASVLGTMEACALLNLPVHVVGLIPSTENMPSGNAVKPGDVITSMSGQTIEVINTDAEGRLILADALTYAERFNPTLVLDIATLTGAMVVALGNVTTGFMTQDDALAKLITEAAEESNDKAWRMPLDDAYQEAINSPIADIANSTQDRSAGSITAACFLSRFTKKYRWAHLDIAGTAWVSGAKRNATGRPVSLLTQLIRHVAQSH